MRAQHVLVTIYDKYHGRISGPSLPGSAAAAIGSSVVVPTTAWTATVRSPEQRQTVHDRGQRLFQGSWGCDCNMVVLVCIIVLLCDPIEIYVLN